MPQQGAITIPHFKTQNSPVQKDTGALLSCLPYDFRPCWVKFYQPYDILGERERQIGSHWFWWTWRWSTQRITEMDSDHWNNKSSFRQLTLCILEWQIEITTLAVPIISKHTTMVVGQHPQPPACTHLAARWSTPVKGFTRVSSFMR